MCWHGSNVAAQHVAGGPAALLHRRAGQRGEADDVAHGVDVRHCGLEVLVALEPAAIVGFEAGAVRAAVRSVSPTRPTLNSTVSPSSRLPLSSSTATRPGFGSWISTTLSPRRNIMPSERAWCSSVSMISWSQNSSSCERPSTTVTCTPSVANMMAYSRPITPPPTTIIDRGTWPRLRISSESKTVSPLNGMWSGRDGPGAGGEQNVSGFEDLPLAAAGDFDAVRIDERRLAADDVRRGCGRTGPE